MPGAAASAAVSMRDDVAEAFDELAGEPSGEAEAAAPAREATPEPAAAPQPETEEREPAAGAARDASGRFAPKGPTPKGNPAAAPLAGAPQAPAAAAAAAESAQPALKPPQDWKAEAREKWATVPRFAQEEAVRVHLEARKVMEAAAADKRAASEWRETVAPYEHMFRAAGLGASQAVGSVLQQYAALQTAPVGIRAQILGGLIRNHLGTDEGALRALASVIDGQGAPASGAAPVAGLSPQELDAMLERKLQERQHREQAQHVATVVQEFEASAPEFREEVMQEMTALVAVDRQQNPGKPWTVERLKALHDRACLLNPRIAAILKQREDAKAAANAKASTSKARAAETGLRNEPGGPAGSSKARTTADDVAEAYDELARRK